MDDGQTDTLKAVVPLYRCARKMATFESAEYGPVNVTDHEKRAESPKPWKKARIDGHGRRLPCTIAHRGYRAKYPENSMAAFRGAIEAGTDALETDVHLSKDGVVVLSHDLDLKRCYGISRKLIDCDWEYLKLLRSTRAPGEPMSRLQDLLEYIAQPGLESVWVLLDIKFDNDPADVMRLMAQTISVVKPGRRPWNQRLVIGCWTPTYVSCCQAYLPDFSISFIGAYNRFARRFFAIENCGMGMFSRCLVGPTGGTLMNEAKARDREIFIWTVNDPNVMRWSIQNRIDGVITDDPYLFKKICDEWTDDEPPVHVGWVQYAYALWLYLATTAFLFNYTIQKITHRLSKSTTEPKGSGKPNARKDL